MQEKGAKYLFPAVQGTGFQASRRVNEMGKSGIKNPGTENRGH